MVNEQFSMIRIAAIGVAAVGASVASAQTLYVDDDALAGGDGSSWPTAYKFLQDALADAAAAGGVITEIRVGQSSPGQTYTPDQDEANPGNGTSNCCVPHGGQGCDDASCEALVCAALGLCCAIGWDLTCVDAAASLCGGLCIFSRTATFQLIDGVSLVGGYAGIGEPDPDARDVELFLTVLSGDLAGNDGPGAFDNDEENAYTVVTGSGTNLTAVLDGFTISGGNANGPDDGELEWIRGAGIWNFSGSPTIMNCRFEFNRVQRHGGGMYNFDCNPTVTGCTFVGNSAGSLGGGSFNVLSSPTFINCTFSGNTGSAGGGMYNNNNGNAVITDCQFIGNTSTNGVGGGMVNSTNSLAQITGCNFVNNDSGNFNGGGMANGESNPTVIGCTFDGNSGADGGGMRNFFNSSPVVTNCLFVGNNALISGGGIASAVDSNPIVTNCTIAYNTAALSAGGVYTTDSPGGHSTLTADNCIFYGNNDVQIVDDSGATTTVSYSAVQGGWSGLGSNNIDADPLFVDPVNGDYHLLPGSPCIDAADNTAVPAGVTTDLDGNPRCADDLATMDTGNGECPIVDMGSYEFPTSCPWDLDCDANVGITDFLALLAAWGTDPGGPPDFGGDGNVGITDFLDLLANWGPCL